MDLQATLEQIVTESLEDETLFLVAVKIKGTSTGSKVLIFVDGDEGVSIDACARISRQVANQVEALELIDQAYTLEVSSPGLDQPLAHLRQYQKNIGRKVKVTLKDEQIKEGELVKVDPDEIVIKTGEKKKKKKETQPTERLILPFADIIKTNVLVSFK